MCTHVSVINTSHHIHPVRHPLSYANCDPCSGFVSTFAYISLVPLCTTLHSLPQPDVSDGDAVRPLSSGSSPLHQRDTCSIILIHRHWWYQVTLSKQELSDEQTLVYWIRNQLSLRTGLIRNRTACWIYSGPLQCPRSPLPVWDFPSLCTPYNASTYRCPYIPNISGFNITLRSFVAAMYLNTLFSFSISSVVHFVTRVAK